MNLVGFMAAHSRCLLIGPGRGDQWKIVAPERFDAHANSILKEFHKRKIPVYTGENLFDGMSKRDIWHPENTSGNRVMMTKYLANAITFTEAFAKMKQARLNS